MLRPAKEAAARRAAQEPRQLRPRAPGRISCGGTLAFAVVGYRFGHVLVVLALGASGAGLSSLDMRSSQTTTSVRSVPVPPTVGTLLTVGNRLEVSGCEDGGTADLVDPETLALRPMPCGVFPWGEQVSYKVLATAPRAALYSCLPDVAVVRATRRAAGGGAEAVGPTFMRFAGDYCSTTRPISAYTAGSLWLYDCAVGPGGHGGEAARLSGSTGALERAIPMPDVCYTTFAADNYGAFVGSYDNAGPVYFVANGAREAAVALRTDGRVNWLYSSGGSVFADIGTAGNTTCRPAACGVWRFSGADAKASLVLGDGAADDLVSTPVLAGGKLFSFVLGSTKASNATVLDLVSIAPGSPSVTVLARLQLQGLYSGPPVLVWSHGSLFVLTPHELYRYHFS
jgi:hypothetical protein